MAKHIVKLWRIAIFLGVISYAVAIYCAMMFASSWSMNEIIEMGLLMVCFLVLAILFLTAPRP